MKKRGKSKAQVSMEFLMVIGFAFLLTIPLVIIFYQQSKTINTDVTSTQVDKVASEIRDAADEVYYLGEPSKKTVKVYMPEGIKSITINGKKLVFLVDGPGGDYEVVKWTVTNVTGTLNPENGIHNVAVEAQSTQVLISST